MSMKTRKNLNILKRSPIISQNMSSKISLYCRYCMSHIVWWRSFLAVFLLLLRESANEAGGWSDGGISNSPLGFQAINNIQTANLAFLSISFIFFPLPSSSSLIYPLCPFYICFHLLSLSPPPWTWPLSPPLISPICRFASPSLLDS